MYNCLLYSVAVCNGHQTIVKLLLDLMDTNYNNDNKEMCFGRIDRGSSSSSSSSNSIMENRNGDQKNSLLQLVDIDDDGSDINVDAASSSSSNSRVKSYLFNFKIIKSIRKNNINNKSNNNNNSCHEDHDITTKRLDYLIHITPLMLACYYGKLSVVRELLWRRFDFLSVDSESNSLLHYLSRCRHKDYLDIILGKKIQYCHRLAC